jgi:hypothetical protein
MTTPSTPAPETPPVESGQPQPKTPRDGTNKALRVAILYKRNTEPDESLMRWLEENLTQNGQTVFIDRHLEMGVDWAREIEKQIRESDAIIPLLSAESVRSEMMGFEIEHAHETAQVQHGRPYLLPVRVNYTGPLPEPLGGILHPIQYFLWQGNQDKEGLLAELFDALRHLPSAEPVAFPLPEKGHRLTPLPPAPAKTASSEPPPHLWVTPLALESVGGAVPLESQYYVKRVVDTEMQNALSRRDSIVLIKGARQMGKTSLLARGLQFARESGARTAFMDCQKLNAFNLDNVNNFYMTLAESLADQLDLPMLPSEAWDIRRGPNINFERYVRREVLGRLQAPLVWGLDEVDRLFSCSFGSEVFGLFRSWHNERALDPTGPWAGLTLAIAYATEAHLFIPDMNQSPFNVGTRLALDDFLPVQIDELNRRYGNPLKNSEELNRFARLVGGHPYLVRRGLYEFTLNKTSLDTFETMAPLDEGIYGDHLRRILVLLAKDPALMEVVRGLLHEKPCPSPESFYRLRSAGVIAGHSPSDARPRCRLYAMFLRRHLQ